MKKLTGPTGFSPAREELAWAAGFFDGEGYVGSYKREFRIAVPQVHRAVLDRFAAAVGVGSVSTHVKPAAGNRQARYVYTVGGHPLVQAVMAMLWHWLSPVKREQFRAALTSVKLRAHLKYRLSCPHASGRKTKDCRLCRDIYRRRYFKNPDVLERHRVKTALWRANNLDKSRAIARRSTSEHRRIRKLAAALLVAA